MASLHEAAAAGEVERVGELLAGGADVHAMDATGATALGKAARNGHAHAVRRLLDANANPKATSGRLGATMLHFAAEAGSIEVIRALLEAGAEPTATAAHGATP